MKTPINKYRLFVGLFLAIVLLSLVAGEATATPFFDRRAALDLKADSRLRAALPTILQRSSTELSLIVVFSSVPSRDQLSDIEAIGRIRSFTGHVATIDVSSTSLEELATLDFVESISKPRILKSELDASVPEILAPDVWSQVRDSDGNPVDGSGVVVGIVDSGIDFRHRDFFFGNGTNKILYIWDQSVEGKPPSPFDYGNECTPNDIRDQICSEVDGGSNGLERGHGTAVAAVAASTGRSADGMDSCMLFDGTRWFNETNSCQASNVPSFPVIQGPDEYLYFGSFRQFNKIYFDLSGPGDYEELNWEYSKGAGTWTQLPNDTIAVSSQDLSFISIADSTGGLHRSGTFAFAPPTTWKTDTVNGVSGLYWVRVSASVVNQAADAYKILKAPMYTGVAPGASIIAVKLKSGSEDRVLDGMNYVIQKAQELGRPLVIDHSLGDSLGSHDGTEPLEIALTEMSDNGIPIVVAAGNSRNLNLHARGKVHSGQPMTVFWSVNQYESGTSVDLWYPVSENVGLSVETPSGVVVSGPTNDEGVNTPDANVVIQQGQRSSGKEWWIDINAAGGKDLQISPWSFTLTSQNLTGVRWDAWVEPGQFTLNATNLYIIDPQDTIDYPGTARGVITVGSYETKLFWRSGCSACIAYSLAQGKHGIWWTAPPAPEVGDLAYSSSMGPTRDGRMKPEITAPGAQIIAARASTRQQRNSDPDNYHQVWRGTSFAAPHVVGVIAMMLQMNPSLSPNQIRAILTQEARLDDFTGDIDKKSGSNLWGWGKVNSLLSVRDAPNFYSVRVEINAVPGNFVVNVNLDGQKTLTVPLHDGTNLVFEFKRGGTHTIQLNPDVIQVSSGIRYVASGTPWRFSSGGVRKFIYKLQYYLDATTPYGYTTGTGWYDANTTVMVGVYPLEVSGHRFEQWTGAVKSTSPSVQVTMDSEKQLVAEWVQDGAIARTTSWTNFALIGIVVVAVASSMIILIKTGRIRLPLIRRSHAILRHLSES